MHGLRFCLRRRVVWRVACRLVLRSAARRFATSPRCASSLRLLAASLIEVERVVFLQVVAGSDRVVDRRSVFVSLSVQLAVERIPDDRLAP